MCLLLQLSLGARSNRKNERQNLLKVCPRFRSIQSGMADAIRSHIRPFNYLAVNRHTLKVKLGAFRNSLVSLAAKPLAREVVKCGPLAGIRFQRLLFTAFERFLRSEAGGNL